MSLKVCYRLLLRLTPVPILPAGVQIPSTDIKEISKHF